MDGHGGSLISSFVSANFVNLMLNMNSYKTGKIEQALIETFLKFDELLRLEKVNKMLNECMIEQIKKEKMECCFFNQKDINNFSSSAFDSSEDDSTDHTSFKSNKSFDNLVQLIQNDRIINLTNPNIDGRSTNATTTERAQLVNFRPQSPIILKNHNIQLNIKNSSSMNNLRISNIDDLVAKDMGTTCNIVLLKNKTLYIANVGDSRSFMFKNGKAIPLNLEHKTSLQSEYQRIINSDTKIMNNRVEGRLNLTRAIGDLTFKQNPSLKFYEQAVIAYPEIIKVPITNEIEFIVMGCDGVWDCVEPQKFCEYINEKLKKNERIDNVIAEVFNQIISTSNDIPIGTDNMTCIIIQLKK